MRPPDPRENDPNFLMCLALSYLGLPPSIWRWIVNAFLEAVSQEYRERHGEEQGAQEFEAWRVAYQGWSTFNKFKAVIVFLAESKIGLIPVRAAAATALRNRVLAMLAERGIQFAAVETAGQIIRKASVYLEIAWVTGCAAYCGGLAYANAIIDFSVAAVDAIATFSHVVQQFAGALTQIIVRPIVVARAMLDPTNWDTSPMPTVALAVRLVGNVLWAGLQPDNPNTFLANLSRPMSDFHIPPSVITEIANAMTQTVNARGGIQSAILFTPDLLNSISPLEFVRLLKDWGLINFVRSPEQIADAAFAH